MKRGFIFFSLVSYVSAYIKYFYRPVCSTSIIVPCVGVYVVRTQPEIITSYANV